MLEYFDMPLTKPCPYLVVIIVYRSLSPRAPETRSTVVELRCVPFLQHIPLITLTRMRQEGQLGHLQLQWGSLAKSWLM